MRRSILYTDSEVEHVSGFVGDFTVDRSRKKARSVNMDKSEQAAASARRNVRPRRSRTNLTED